MAVADGPSITARTTPGGDPVARLSAKDVIDDDGQGCEPGAADIRRIGE